MVCSCCPTGSTTSTRPGASALLEEPLYFAQFRFHEQKLVLHRASLRAASGGGKAKVSAVAMWRRASPRPPVDYTGRGYYGQLSAHGASQPQFLQRDRAADAFFDGRKRYFQTNFCVAQCKQHRLLLEPAGQPTGGQ